MTKIENLNFTDHTKSWLVENEFEHRNALLNEMHARPFTPVDIPYRLFHYAYLVDEETKQKMRAELTTLANLHNAAPPSQNKFWKLSLNNKELRWEEHTEFSTYRWGYSEKTTEIFGNAPVPPLAPTGKLLVATQLQIIPETQLNIPLEELFDPNSLCLIETFGGSALIATDFQTDIAAHTRILIIDKGLGELQRGILTQRILEIETYRTLALMGLPMARSAAPKVKQIEVQLSDITSRLSQTENIENNQMLLSQIMTLAAEIEAEVAKSAFRFGAGRAYYNIVKTRLQSIAEKPVGNRMTFTSFFKRGLAPAIATCDAIEKRQSDLSNRLVRTAELLRTRLQFALQHQNSDLLKSMNERTELQFQLQQTVEGLSVIAISYYTIGLISYVLKGFTSLEEYISYKTAVAISVPTTIFTVWLITRYIRNKLHK